jgi:uncharacterized membrane protein YraQ (UPF0718 family)
VLEQLAAWLVCDVFGAPEASRWSVAVQFFIADSVKIIFLLGGMIFVIAVLRTFLPHGLMKQWMGQRGFLRYFFASSLGAITPFCSCSSIPLFFSFLRSGIPLGVSFSFLITSPIINEYLFVLMIGFFGWKIALAYVASGIAIGVFAGMALGGMKLEGYLEQDIVPGKAPDLPEMLFPGFLSRVRYGAREARDIIVRIWLWVLAGVGLGAVIHNYIPREAIDILVSSTGAFSVPLATLVGVPMYGSCAAIVPVAVALFQKGVPLGTSLSFMMAVSALSLPEAVMLRRAMKLPLILMFFAITTLAIILTGYLFNFLQSFLA